ncbi:MAG: TonB-dependent receptor, partial [Candidatus Brocadiales bacterium]|nr:TonB-dependent receptor [Candidatus Brocadiales bacterium]
MTLLLSERISASGIVFQTLLLCIAIFALSVPVQADEEPQKSVLKGASQNNAKPATRLIPAGITRLNEITVTAKRHEEKIFDVPYAAHVITSDDILMQKSIKTLPEALREETSIMIQKTSHGQGSPYIRGFTSFHNLMLIDGIRLNNSVFREGPNQYWNTIDPYSIERLEVIKGPGSVMYGSDAIGGTVNALTKSRKEYGEGLLYNGRTYYRYASGEKSQVTRVEVSASYNDKLGITAGGTFKGFGNMRAGDDMGLLRNTKYEEVDGDIKLEYFLDKNKKFIFAYQDVEQSDVPRTEQTIHSESFRGTSKGTDIKRDIDQDRSLVYMQFHWDKISKYVERAKFSLSHHNQREKENRIRSNGLIREIEFNVDTLGLWAQFESVSPFGHLSYGFDFYHDNVTSSRRDYSAGGVITNSVQGTVGDDSTYDLFGIYFQDEISLSDKLEMLIGMRYSYVALDADKVQDPNTGGEIDITSDWEGLVGNLRFMYYPDDNWNLFTGVSQGFRAPNLSDMTRFTNDSSFETPTEGLDDEDFITFEVGAKADFQKWTAQASYYYTIVEDMLVRSPTGGTV